MTGLVADPISNGVVVAAILVVGFLMERYYVSRLTMVQNAAALWLHLEGFETVGPASLGYALVGVVAAVYGLVAYLMRIELGVPYYTLVYVLFAPAPVAAFVAMTAVFGPALSWLVLALGLGAVGSSWMLVRVDSRISPAGRLPLPARLADRLFPGERLPLE